MQCLCVVGLWHPKHKRLKYYVLQVFPFGARNSVCTFGTIAFALSCVLVSLFKLSLTQYVDDFPQVEPRTSAESALVCEAVLALLGWEVKQVDGKVPAFEQSFVALGVEYDMHPAERDLLAVRDKPGRHEKVQELVSKIVGENKGSHSMLQSLRGLVNFSRSQCFGRCGAVALNTISKLLSSPEHVLKPADIDALLFWPRFLQTSRPREIRVHDSRTSRDHHDKMGQRRSMWESGQSCTIQ